MDISKNPITPKDYENMDINEKLDIKNMKEHLKNQHTIITNSSKWARINEDDLLRIFKVDEMPLRMNDEIIKERILENFNEREEDPLSVESLKKQFPSFPEEWHEYVSKSAIDKINIIKEEQQVIKEKGEFNISFK